MVEQAAPDTPVDRPGWVLEFDERFDGPDLDRGRWIPHHLPH
jgi:hypothetical protein